MRLTNCIIYNQLIVGRYMIYTATRFYGHAYVRSIQAYLFMLRSAHDNINITKMLFLLKFYMYTTDMQLTCNICTEKKNRLHNTYISTLNNQHNSEIFTLNFHSIDFHFSTRWSFTLSAC